MGESHNEESTTRKKSWFDGLKAEYAKVVWPDKESVIKQTAAVIGVTVALSVIIALLDTVIKYGVDFLVGL